MPFLSAILNAFGFGRAQSVASDSSDSSDEEESHNYPISNGIPLCTRCNAHFELPAAIRGTSCTSMLSERLRAGYVPTDLEAAQIPSCVQSLSHEVDRLDVQLAWIDQVRGQLHGCRNVFHRMAEEHQGLLAPIRKLPVETLSMIFSYHSYPYGLSINMAAPKRRISPITLDLAQTCSRWRQVVFSQPALWSRLFIDLNHPSPNIDDLVHYYLRHSANAPLVLWIEAIEPDRWSTIPGRWSLAPILSRKGWYILEMLMKEGHRWKHVTFRLECFIFHTEAFTNRRYSLAKHDYFPILESIQLAMTGDPMAMSDEDECSAFYRTIVCDAPKLHWLTTNHLHGSLFGVLQFDQLTHITLEVPSERLRSDVPRLLKLCPRLEGLVLNEGPDVLQSHESFGTLSIWDRWNHDRLKSLVIKVDLESKDSLNDASFLLCNLELPSIASLKLVGKGLKIDPFLQAYFCESLEAFLVRSSSSTLKELSIFGAVFLTGKQLVQILTLTPSLEYFLLSSSSEIRPYSLFKALTFPKPLLLSPSSSSSKSRKGKGKARQSTSLSSSTTKAVLLPHLKNLTIRLIEAWGSKPKIPNPDVMISMVESRRWNSVRGIGMGIGAFPTCMEDQPLLDELKYFELDLDQIYTQKYGLSPEWFQNFRSAAEPRLRELASMGLELRIELPTYTYEHPLST
ncbi:hypothetical protein D9758_011647 [Tetrapyrgos nigripes]|uniref:F-box domain-containing protein n=1 Tax=Tetrapyrgos nigripes TaxID=182062 RepID=A0A8H5CSA5_9AGAR|nr:hypothetical protein D9758_011647 [Tetrapyrgos nigripes]